MTSTYFFFLYQTLLNVKKLSSFSNKIKCSFLLSRYLVLELINQMNQ